MIPFILIFALPLLFGMLFLYTITYRTNIIKKQYLCILGFIAFIFGFALGLCADVIAIPIVLGVLLPTWIILRLYEKW